MTTENPDFLKKCTYSGCFTRETEVEGNLQKSEAKLQKAQLQISAETAATKMGFTFQVERTFLVGRGFENPGFCKIWND